MTAIIDPTISLTKIDNEMEMLHILNQKTGDHKIPMAIYTNGTINADGIKNLNVNTEKTIY